MAMRLPPACSPGAWYGRRPKYPWNSPGKTWLIAGYVGGGGLSRTAQSWTKAAERIGLLVLIAVAAIISWVLVLRAFGALLTLLGG